MFEAAREKKKKRSTKSIQFERVINKSKSD